MTTFERAVSRTTGLLQSLGTIVEEPVQLDQTGPMVNRPRVVWMTRVALDGSQRDAIDQILRANGVDGDAGQMVDVGIGAVDLGDGVQLRFSVPADRDQLQVTIERAG